MSPGLDKVYIKYSKCVFSFPFRLTWMLFFIFTFLHLYSNFRAVSSVVMETLNITRLHILVQEYLLHDRMLTPDEVAKREPVLFGKVLIY